MTQTIENVVCPACSSLCDDLAIEVDAENRMKPKEHSCVAADAFYSQFSEAIVAEAKLDGAIVSFSEAVQAAAKIIEQSQSPLIFGTEFQSSDVYRAACGLADKIGATIDSFGNAQKSASMVALQTVGMSTATLGEIKNRADLVLFWGCDPAKSHPCLIDRILEPAGQFVPEGRSGRKLISLNSSPTNSSNLCDENILLDAEYDYELISALRASMKGIDISQESVAGLKKQAISQLADSLQSCRYGVVFFGTDLSKQGHATVEALFSLVRELNGFTRFVAFSLQDPRAQTSANVLAWQTGFPGSVNLSGGYPRYNPEEFSANELLERGEVDAVVLLGSNALENLSELAKENLQKIPAIHLRSPAACEDVKANVEITVGVPGVHHSGVAYRMDDVPLQIRKIVDVSLPTVPETIQAISERLDN